MKKPYVFILIFGIGEKKDSQKSSAYKKAKDDYYFQITHGTKKDAEAALNIMEDNAQGNLEEKSVKYKKLELEDVKFKKEEKKEEKK